MKYVWLWLVLPACGGYQVPPLSAPPTEPTPYETLSAPKGANPATPATPAHRPSQTLTGEGASLESGGTTGTKDTTGDLFDADKAAEQGVGGVPGSPEPAQ